MTTRPTTKKPAPAPSHVDMDALYERRRINLITYFTEPTARTVRAVGMALNQVDGSYISQLKAGKRRITENVARRLELAMERPSGYLDVDRGSLVDGGAIGKRVKRVVKPTARVLPSTKKPAGPISRLEATALATNILMQARAQGHEITDVQVDELMPPLVRRATRTGTLTVDDVLDLL